MKKILLLAIWVFLIPVLLAAQEQTIVTYQIDCPANVKAGDSLHLIVTASVSPGWYICAPVEINTLQGMQITQLQFYQLPTYLRRVPLQIPPPVQKNSFAVYQHGPIIFRQTFIVNTRTRADSIVLRGHFTYQACNERSCYPPVTEKFEKTIRIIKSER